MKLTSTKYQQMIEQKNLRELQQYLYSLEVKMLDIADKLDKTKNEKVKKKLETKMEKLERILFTMLGGVNGKLH